MSRRTTVVASLTAAFVAACALDIDGSGAGRACSAGRCATGYVCNAALRCVPAFGADEDAGSDVIGAGGAPDHADGSGGAPDHADGSGGATVTAGGTRNAGGNTPAAGGASRDAGGGVARGGSPSGGQSPVGAATAAGGTGPVPGQGAAPNRGSGGVRATDMDASTGAPPDSSCSHPAVYYRDEDGDGFGRSDVTRRSCVELPGWSPRGGDCADAEPLAFPGQSNYFGVGYTVAGGQSYDYDCSGSEEPDPEGAGLAPDCPALALLVCTGSGFASTGRKGIGVDPTCGSTSQVTCAGLLACAPTSTTVPAKGCR